MIRYGSVCSGIEAATVAWHPLGWKPAFFSEIEAFPRAVLQHRWSGVPLHGDFTTIRGDEYGPIDLLVGGTPCQSFSVAGLRGGLADDRGNLALEFLRLAQRARPRWLVWENVPGVLSSNGGRDFGSILGGMGELGYGWAYRVLDAQHFGVPQRRRRVFVVGYLGNWRRAAAVLFERHGLQGHPPPRRKAGEGIAPTIASRPTGGGGLGTDFDCDGGLIAQTLLGKANDSQDTTRQTYIADTVRSHPRAGSNSVGNIAMCLNAHGGSGRLDAESETLVPLMATGCHGSNGAGIGVAGDPSMPLDTTGAMAIAFNLRGREGGSQPEPDDLANIRAVSGGSSRSYIAFDTTQITSAANRSQPQPGDPCHPIPAHGHAPTIAFSSKDHGADAGELAPTLRAGTHSRSHANAGVPPAIAYRTSGNCGVMEQGDKTACINTATDPNQNIVKLGAAVRRLTPRECERLQGFPDDYTLIPYRGKPAADGPRYKALGNSMAVPVMRWIGQRIAMVEALQLEKAA